MLRALWFLTLVTLAAVLMAWLIDRPGVVILQWQSYKIETSVAFLIAAIIVVAALTAVAYRVFLAIRRVPTQVSAVWRDRRHRQGYQALTRGMVAIAAGDADEASRQEKRTQVLLKDPPLTMLLSAQTAQLNGDEKAAERFFQAMTEQTDTEFLGVRGLLNQALNRRDGVLALTLAQRAYQLRPDSDWVAEQLFDLQIQEGLWLEAQITTDEQVQALHIDKVAGKRRKALLTFQQGVEMSAVGDIQSAEKNFKAAYIQDPTFVPSILAHANVLIQKGKFSNAAAIIKKAWQNHPHPDLVSPFWLGTQAHDGMAILKATESLVLTNPNHPESLVALARAALEARLWGEARKHLEVVTPESDLNDEARICRLWAELEESDNQDLNASRGWLKRASLASDDPAWICGNCGNAVDEWSVLCGNCGRFDTLSWGRPRRVSHYSLPEPTSGIALTVSDD